MNEDAYIPDVIPENDIKMLEKYRGDIGLDLEKKKRYLS